MAVVVNKPKIRDKSISLLKESLKTALNIKEYVNIETHKEG